MSATTLYRIDGVKLANGKQAYGSREMSVWLPTYIRYMWETHRIRLTVIKVADMAATLVSARTHVGGNAWDGRSWTLTSAQMRTHIAESTRFGCPGAYRVRSQGFTPHTHNMLHTKHWTQVTYQIAALLRGRDGLARNGPDLDRAHRPAQPWPDWKDGLAAMLEILEPKPALPPIPRHITARPWMIIPVDGVRSGVFWSRVQWQLQIRPTGRLDHYTVRALRHWLDPTGRAGGGDDGTGILRRIDVLLLQSRVGAYRDGDWGPATTRAFQTYLNRYR